MDCVKITESTNVIFFLNMGAIMMKKFPRGIFVFIESGTIFKTFVPSSLLYIE